MSQLTNSDFSNDITRRQYFQVKQDRKKTEENFNILKNKTTKLRLQVNNIEKKTQKIKAMASKFWKIREEKLEDQEKSESSRNDYKKAINLQKIFNRQSSEKIRKQKEENIEKIQQAKQEIFKDTKDRQKFEEFLLNQEYLEKINKNLAIKNYLRIEKKLKINQNENYKRQKMMETQKYYWKNVEDEREIISSKRIEKEIMEEADLAVLEFLQSGKFNNKC